LLAVLAVLVVGVDAADVILKGTCYGPTTIDFYNQTFGARDIVKNILAINPTCNKTSVTIAKFNRSSIFYIPPLLFSHFPNLKQLIIWESQLWEIRPNTFLNAKKLTGLGFEFLGNEMTSLNASAFTGATSLEGLWIHQARFVVHVDALRGLKNLTAFGTIGGYMPSIKKELFVDNSKLTTIGWPWCGIPSIDPLAFSTLPNLEILDFKYNSLTSLDKGLIRNNPKLTEFYFSYNKLSAIDESFFANNPNLQTILLHSNQLEVIPSGLFAKNRMLWHLQLSGNRIKSLSNIVFQNLPKLYWLGMGYNLLTALPRDLFSGNGELNGVWLDFNQLNVIHKTTFYNLKNLATLSLLNNTCINAQFSEPINATVVMNALAKCDANANNCTDNSAIKEQLKTIITLLTSVANKL
jgi:Leucine-rich repeat (LRR) protein